MFFHDFLAAGEAALAADWIVAWKTLWEAALEADLILLNHLLQVLKAAVFLRHENHEATLLTHLPNHRQSGNPVFGCPSGQKGLQILRHRLFTQELMLNVARAPYRPSRPADTRSHPSRPATTARTPSTPYPFPERSKR